MNVPMPAPADRQDEPAWVKRLRARGFDVQGGEGNLPEEPRVWFGPAPQRRLGRMLRSAIGWFRAADHPSPKARNAPVP